jgi:hypothetical protein
MTVQAFTRNYRDHSNGEGFQFEFFCDKCGNGFRSSFVTNKLGVAAGFLRAAGSIFGHDLSSVGWGAEQVKDALRGPAWDRAFSDAIAECKPKFRQCPRCGQWVCPEICWNEPRSLCMGCAPDVGREAAAAQAMAARDQLWQKARQVDQVPDIDMRRPQVAACPCCGARTDGGKFCSSCGQPLVAARPKCGKCGADMNATARFCPECGTPRG